MATAVGDAVSALGPSTPREGCREALRAGVGAGLGLGILSVVMVASGIDMRLGLFLIAPFGATTVLVFAAPSSPLAQPWNAVAGNTIGGLVGVGVTLLVPHAGLRVALAVGATVAVMSLCRAMHPPAGAVAMTAALSPDTVHALGVRFALAPVAVGTLALVIFAMAYGSATRRRYPFRQFDPTPPPTERLGLTEGELTAILQRYRQSLNLGVGDLVRLIGAAEVQAAARRTGPAAVADIMSVDLVTVAPTDPVSDIAELFGVHGFTSLPVVAPDGRFRGMVFQLHLVTARDTDGPELRAVDVMTTDLAVVEPTTRVAAVLPMLGEQGCAAVPVVEGDGIVGIVTQTDLIAALARLSLASGDPTARGDLSPAPPPPVTPAG